MTLPHTVQIVVFNGQHIFPVLVFHRFKVAGVGIDILKIPVINDPGIVIRHCRIDQVSFFIPGIIPFVLHHGNRVIAPDHMRKPGNSF